MLNKKILIAAIAVLLAALMSISTMGVFALEKSGSTSSITGVEVETEDESIETNNTDETEPTEATETTEATGSTEVAKKAGDVDGDGDIDVNDATTYQLILAGKEEPTPAFEKNAETVTDGKKNITDVTGIQAYVAKVLIKLPITPDGYYSEIIRP